MVGDLVVEQAKYVSLASILHPLQRGFLQSKAYVVYGKAVVC